MALRADQIQLRIDIELQNAINKIGLLENEISDLNHSFLALKKEMQGMEKEILKNDDAYKQAKKTLNEVVREHGKNSEAANVERKKLEELKKTVLSGNEAYSAKEKQLSELSDKIAEASKAIDMLRKSEKDSLRTADSLEQEYKQITNALRLMTFGTKEYIEQLKRKEQIEKELESRTQASGRRNGYGNIISEGGLGGTLAGLTAMFYRVMAIVGALKFLKDAFEKIWEVGTKRESLNNLLLTTLNNSKAATAEAQKIIREFATKTGTDLENATMAFKRMSDIGIIPTMDTMISLSDMAKSSNKSVSDYVEAIADSQQNENERLKEFGINAQVQGSKVVYTFKGIRTEVDNNALAISKYLISLGNVEGVMGATTKASEAALGWWVRFKNTLNDWYENAFKKIEPSLKSLLKGLTEMVSPAKSATQVFEEQKQKVIQLNDSLPGLLTRYEELSKITKPTKEQQKELRDIIEQIGIIVPNAKEGMDKYGQTLGINTTIAKDYIEQQKLILQYTNRIAIQETENDILRMKREQSLVEQSAKFERTADGRRKATERYLFGVQNKYFKMTKEYISEDEFNKLQSSLQALNNGIKGAEETLKVLKGENLVTPKNEEKDKNKQTELEKERIKREAQLAKMQRDATADELAKKLAREREIRIEAEFKALEEIAKMDSEAIKDELERNESNIRLEASMKVAEKDRELKKAKVSQQDHDRLLEDFRVSTYKAAERQIEDLKEKSRREDELKAEESAKKILAVTDRLYEQEINARIKQKERVGDDFGVLMERINLLNFQWSKELRNKELTEEEKLAIEKSYMEQSENAWDDYFVRKRNKYINATRQSLENDLEQTKHNIFKHHDAQVAMLNFEYHAELENAVKIGASTEEIHRKYALRRRELEKGMWMDIASLAIQAYSNITNSLAESRNLDNQAEQINADNAKNRKVNSLKQQYESGLITKKKYDAEIEKADKEYEKKQRAIKNRQAQSEHDANVIKATQQAIQSVLQTMSSVPYPFNIPLVAIQTALSFDQVQKLSSMPIPEYFWGGDTGEGNDKTRVNDGKNGFLSILHPNEYVVPKNIRQQDWWKPIERVVEAKRINSYFQGGSPTPMNFDYLQNPNFNANKELVDVITKQQEVLDSLKTTIESGIMAKLLFQSRDAEEIFKILDENSKTKKNALAK